MATTRPVWLTPANGATLARAAAIPAILALLAIPSPPAHLAAAALFGLAAMTDALDGYLARRWEHASALGASLDLTADKLLVAAVLIDLAGRQAVPVWAAIVIISRELLVSGIRAYAGAQGTRVPAQLSGKLKMAVTCVAIAAAILALPGATWLVTAAAALTVVSAWPYVVSASRLAADPR